jgi:hypothetical protein
LDAAIALLGALAGAPADAAREWVDGARARIAADRAADICRARAILVTDAVC